MATESLPPFHGNISYHAQHSPLGAFFSFTCGLFGSKGGFGLQIGKPGDQELFIGVKDGDRSSDAPIKCLPFFEGAQDDEAARYDVEGKSTRAARPQLAAYRRDEIQRHYGWGTDAWTTPDFTFSIYTPFFPVPEYGQGETHQLSVLPAVIAELTVDNTSGTTTKTGVFAIRFGQSGVRLFDNVPGFAIRNEQGVRAQLVGSKNCNIESVMRWKVEDSLNDINPRHGLGNTPGIAFTVPAGAKATLRLALGVHIDNVVTSRLRGKYLYTRSYGGLENVLDAALTKFDHLKQQAQLLDQQLLASKLSADQQWLIAHSTRSYHGSTQLLDIGGEPFWVVNEGEYCMMNTLDLSVDHVFWELRQHPWLVKNLLDRFVRHYSYVDQVKVPKSEVKASFSNMTDAESLAGVPRKLGETLPLDAFNLKPGGISFCHDMGVHNQFSQAGYSSYELANLVGCFSYMTAEQLCNWTLIAACYVANTGDVEWVRQNKHVIDACHWSLQNRCMAGKGDYRGSPAFDSSRCETGAEITTYDSLDHSLAQTRNNLYMATKVWATWYALYRLHLHVKDTAMSELAELGASDAARSIKTQAQPDGSLPAVFEKDNPGFASRILPAVEGLVYVAYCSSQQHQVKADHWLTHSFWTDLISVLRRHTEALLTDTQKRNLFPDGGLKLSSTSDNSWMSKIALFQYVCTNVLKLDADPAIKQTLAAADAAHVKWMTEGESAYWACSDQFVSGVAKGSKYYPRIVTTVLWMDA